MTIVDKVIVMGTTIMISNDLKAELNALKLFKNETYEDVIKNLIDDRKFLNAETLKDIYEAEEEVKQGKTISFEEVKKKMRSNV